MFPMHKNPTIAGLPVVFIWVVAFLSVGAAESRAQNRNQFLTYGVDLEQLNFDKFQKGSAGILIKKGTKIRIPTGFTFQTPKVDRLKITKEVEDFKIAWQKRHPSARLVQVHYYPSYPGLSLVIAREAYVWLYDGDDIFNVQLVRNGLATADDMLLLKQQEDYILVSSALYEAVRKRLIAAETAARDDKLGIWK
jgi:hypothetical protein